MERGTPHFTHRLMESESEGETEASGMKGDGGGVTNSLIGGAPQKRRGSIGINEAQLG